MKLTNRSLLTVTGVMLIGWLGLSTLVLERRSQPIRFSEPTPDLPWGNIIPVRIKARDATHSGAWWHEGDPDRPVLAIFHELGGGRGTALPPARIAAQTGCGFLSVTLRAHGDSEGDTIDYGWSAQHDVIAAIAWIQHHAPNRPILIRGCSMGAAAAIFAAPELAHSVEGYFLECVYSDLSTALWNRVDNRLPPVLREAAWAGLRIAAPWVMGNPAHIAPINAMSKVPAQARVWIVFGEQDRLARPHESEALFAARTTGPTRLFPIPAGHANLYQQAPERMYTLLRAFLNGEQVPD